MARVGKRKPWVVEINTHESNNWYLMGAYPDEDEARMQCKLMQKRAPMADFRFRLTEEWERS